VKSLFRFAPILSIIILFFLFSGCVNIVQKTKINQDGSGTMKIKYWTKSYNVMGDELAGFGFSSRKVKVNYTSEFTVPSNINIEKDQTIDSLYIVTLDVKFSDFSKITEAIAFEKTNAGWEKNSDVINFRYKLAQDTANSKPLGMDEYKLSYEFEFPNEIISTNGEKEGRKVTWNFTVADLKDDIDFTATIKSGN